MEARLYLIGTSHTYQLGPNARHLSETPCTPDDEVAFADWLRAIARQHAVAAIAEELNEDALADARVARSIPQRLARDLGLQFRFCEPSRKWRQDAGILTDDEARAQAWMDNLTAEELQDKQRHWFDLREAFWLEQLQDLAAWPVLFICGADHVQSFGALLATAGIPCMILHKHWRPIAA